jgi:acyl-CoA synthetase (AMP-forming)/AMP-acid ligase II
MRGDRVVLCMENCGEFLEVLFGCWTAGLCAVPVNSKLHVREVEHIAQDSASSLLITTPFLAEALSPLTETVESLTRPTFHLSRTARILDDAVSKPLALLDLL